MEFDFLELKYSISEIFKVAQKLIIFAKNEKIWLLNGEMGAGKTTLAKAICKQLNVTDNITSPTFSIVNEYQTLEKETIYHFDFYRINHEVEALDIGADEYFYSNNLCLIEWSSKIKSLIPQNHLNIEIINISSTERKIRAVLNQ